MIMFMLRCAAYYLAGVWASGHSRDRGSSDGILALDHVERPKLHRNHCRPHGEFMFTQGRAGVEPTPGRALADFFQMKHKQ